MKKFILVMTIALLTIPSNSFAFDKINYDTNKLFQNEEFRTELIKNVTGRNRKISINLKNFNENQSQKIFDHISNIVFYQSNMDIYSISMSGNVIGKSANLVINLDYRMSPDESAKVDEWIKKTMDPFLAQNHNNLEIIKFINDTIVKHVEYDTSYQKNSAYYAVFSKSSLCEGYSFLTYKMLSYAKIESRIISGVAGDEDHMWNLVKYNNSWYHLDVTWNDPVYKGGFKKPLDYVSHEYLMLTSEQISKTHTWDKNIFPFAK